MNRDPLEMLFTGSVPLAPATAVFQALQRHCGARLRRMPDGEQRDWVASNEWSGSHQTAKATLAAADWIASVRDKLLPVPVTLGVLLEPMRRRRHGAVVVVTSDLARQPVGIDLPYEASKAGLGPVIKALARQEALHGIRVNGVAPGPVDTPMLTHVTQRALAAHVGASAKEAIGRELRRRGQAMERVGRPEEVADALVWLASERASYITGQILGVDGGSIHGLP